ncbi:Subtilisin-like protease SBT3.3 [Capsicum baccatum]|uniref:Subtilisin-like protease SBT3.3 n=1 Tax=Capsicum baccatum TaxID=33114 RepID=A0A2G2VCQ0_CAPBA|nr:Subtilisin-like protease SBT3.3 [Capsicum baccatum]
MTRVSFQFHRNGKELAPEVMTSNLPAATDNPPYVGTPRNHDGHGTHVAAIAAGSPVADASYYGLAGGTATGGSPGSRIAVYRVCKPNAGCSGSATMKAFDDARADGVDIINLSFGQPSGTEFEFSRNPVAIGAFYAVQKWIFVVSSAGNDGLAQ